MGNDHSIADIFGDTDNLFFLIWYFSKNLESKCKLFNMIKYSNIVIHKS